MTRKGLIPGMLFYFFTTIVNIVVSVAINIWFFIILKDYANNGMPEKQIQRQAFAQALPQNSVQNPVAQVASPDNEKVLAEPDYDDQKQQLEGEENQLGDNDNSLEL